MQQPQKNMANLLILLLVFYAVVSATSLSMAFFQTNADCTITNEICSFS